MPGFNPSEIIRHTYLNETQEDGQWLCTKIIQAIIDHHNNIDKQPEKVKFLIDANDCKYEEIQHKGKIMFDELSEIVGSIEDPELKIKNLSNSDDTSVMRKALGSVQSLVDIHHAGTAMRFLTAYFAAQDGRTLVLTGSDRMKERPIEILVETLKKLGAEIDYVENHGCPPLKINGQSLAGGEVEIQANVSSQYISALLLIGAH